MLVAFAGGYLLSKVILPDNGKDNNTDYGYYGDYARTKQLWKWDEKNQDVNVDLLYDKGSTYQFTFKLEDGNYVFVSSELKK